MAFVEPGYSRSHVNKAGMILANPEAFSPADQEWGDDVLTNWRACHGYPINTFQATLRTKLKDGYGKHIVAQRLKRAPSIITKLQRFDGMQLARMQDIGGLRAVVGSVAKVRRLEEEYRNTRFDHILTNSKNYIDEPKADGYRSVHLVYRYQNDRVPAYNGLLIELQLRTELQHAWATAVETMGTFLGQALKSGMGEEQWRQFFAQASAALAIIEKTVPVSGFENAGRDAVFSGLAKTEAKLRVLEKLQGFAVAADHITTERGQGVYHLITLDSGRRTVTIRPYPKADLEQATADYSQVEKQTKVGEQVEAVLVAAGPVDALRKAYPNYFLDTQVFVRKMRAVVEEGAEGKVNKRLQRTARKRRR